MAKKKIIILGAGLAGLSAGWHLQKMGVEYQLFEKESEVGGLCRSKKLDGFIFDYDGHLLHFRRSYTFNFVKRLLKDNLAEHDRNAWIYSNGTYTRYPFQANLYGLPPLVVKECVLGYIEASRDGHNKNKNGKDFLNWIKLTFGEGIAKHFMVPYNTKFWTLPPQELNCSWLDGFIPVPSLREVIDGTIEENQRQFGYNVRFWYPRNGGIEKLPLALGSQIKNIQTDCKVSEIDLSKREIKINSKGKEKFDYLISTIPLPDMPRLIKNLPKEIASTFTKLRWNSIFNLNLGIDKKKNFGRHWIYFPHQEVCFFRVGFFDNFSPNLTPLDKSSLYVEVSYSKDKPINKNTIISRINNDLRKIGILSSSDSICVQDVNDIKYGYPIYDFNYHQIRKKILEFFQANHIFGCGRYGLWKYMSIEDAILSGKEVAENLYTAL
jgi:protoporphyrinogen oxidase